MKQDRIKETLSLDEMRFSATVGVARQLYALEHNLPNRFGLKGHKAFWYHIFGAFGEQVVAKRLGIYWDGHVGQLDIPDVGPYDVRASHTKYMILHKGNKDPEERVFIRVVGLAPHFDICGWLWGHEGKVDEYWADKYRNGRPAFFVPEEHCHPMSELPPLDYLHLIHAHSLNPA
jgi:hypothetical protein